MRLELNTNGAWRVVLSGLSQHDDVSTDRYLIARDAAWMLSKISGETNRRPITWRLVSEADGSVVEMCGDEGWRPAYRTGAAA